MTLRVLDQHGVESNSTRSRPAAPNCKLFEFQWHQYASRASKSQIGRCGLPTSDDVDARTYPIRPAASSRCRNDEHERLLLVSVGLAPVGIPVHVQAYLETGFTRQPIRWRRDGPMTKLVVHWCFV